MQYANCHLFSAKAVKQPAQHNFLCLLQTNSYFPTAPFPAADTVQTKKRKAPCALPFFLFVMATTVLVPMPTTAMCSACLFMIVMAMVDVYKRQHYTTGAFPFKRFVEIC